MTEEEVSNYCNIKAREILDLTATLIPSGPMRIVILCGVLGATAIAEGFSRERVVDALNSVFDDIELGDIPGQI